MKNYLVLCIATLLSATVNAQLDTAAIRYAESITAADLKTHLYILASDEYEGRETGKAGQKKAAAYISNYFESLGIPPCVDGSYYQEFPLKQETSLESKAVVNGKEKEFIKDFFFFPGFEGSEIKPEEVIFIGYGIESEDYNDYAGISDVTGKVLMFYDGEPFDGSGNSLITGDEKVSDWSSDWRMKRELAMEKGAEAIIIIKPGFKKYVGRIKMWLQSPGMRLDYETKRGDVVIPVFFISPEMADEIVESAKGKSLDKIKKKISKKGRAVNQTLSTDLVITIDRRAEHFTGENVLAFIEGTDSVLKDEVVIITAHYDHIGIVNGAINNGADDDGSGTVTALEIAQAFQLAKDEGAGTKRSVLVMTVSGEEKGLLGSEWYSEYPIFPLKNTVCDLNIDMIGRLDDKHAGNENYVYLIGSDKLSTALHQVSEQANSDHTQLELDYTFNDPNDPNRFYYRSDHYNFAKNGIPVIFYFSGVHEDYHQPGDDPEKILFDKTAKIGRLVFHTAWELANRKERIVVDVENDFEN